MLYFTRTYVCYNMVCQSNTFKGPFRVTTRKIGRKSAINTGCGDFQTKPLTFRFELRLKLTNVTNMKESDKLCNLCVSTDLHTHTKLNESQKRVLRVSSSSGVWEPL